jgi:hypothetical protein
MWPNHFGLLVYSSVKIFFIFKSFISVHFWFSLYNTRWIKNRLLFDRLSLPMAFGIQKFSVSISLYWAVIWNNYYTHQQWINHNLLVYTKVLESEQCQFSGQHYVCWQRIISNAFVRHERCKCSGPLHSNKLQYCCHNRNQLFLTDHTGQDFIAILFNGKSIEYLQDFKLL